MNLSGERKRNHEKNPARASNMWGSKQREFYQFVVSANISSDYGKLISSTN